MREVGFLEPSYSLYPVLAQIEDLQYERVVLNEQFNWDTPEGLEAALFLLTNPNAPTSVSAEFEQIKSFAEQVEGVLLIDEAYAEFAEWNCMDLALKRARARFKIFIEILFIGGHTMRILCGSCGFNTGAL